MGIPREVKVGGFVFLGLLAAGLIVFLIGDERQMFDSKVHYRALFSDVEGLRRGSEVRMGGVTVGSVDSVEYSKEAKDPTVYVTLGIVKDEAARVRKDSIVKIVAKGMLGDKMVNVSVGTRSQPAIEPGGIIQSEAGEDLTVALSRLGGITGKVEKTVANLERATGLLANEELHQDIRGSLKSMGSILHNVDEGDGYAARLLRDPKESARISNLITTLERATASLDHTLADVNAIVGQVKAGPGLAHEVVYGKEASQAIAQIGGAAEELQLTLKGVREGNGLAKSLIYGGPASEDLTRNLTELSVSLNKIAADARDGKGTVGALLTDPSVYEDLKILLGNVGRNKALRALVRYSIQQDEAAPNHPVRDPAAKAP
ncbi:MAG: MlaD family protein [Polyangiaceae bacterium]|nr:MlaD family protein [Polyangiaceae bacterium]